MNSKELRKEIRISVRDIPEEYSAFTILLPHGTESRVNTSDISLNGFGFTSALSPEEFIVGQRLVLYPLGNEHPVYGNIVHTMMTPAGTRVGVSLLHLGGYTKYKAMVSSLLNKLQSKD